MWLVVIVFIHHWHRRARAVDYLRIFSLSPFVLHFFGENTFGNLWCYSRFLRRSMMMVHEHDQQVVHHFIPFWFFCLFIYLSVAVIANATLLMHRLIAVVHVLLSFYSWMSDGYKRTQLFRLHIILFYAITCVAQTFYPFHSQSLTLTFGFSISFLVVFCCFCHSKLFSSRWSGRICAAKRGGKSTHPRKQ